MHLRMLQVWDDCRPGESTCPLNLHNPCMFTQIDIVPKHILNSTPWHTKTQSVEHARSECATRFITIKVSPTGIETHQPFCKQPWTLADLLFVTSSTWQNKNGYSPNTWKGLLLTLPTSSALSDWNKPSQLGSRDNKPKIPWSNLKHSIND